MRNIGILTFLCFLFTACAEDLQPKDSIETNTKMDYPLKAELSINNENDVWAKIVLSNPNGYEKSFHQPMTYTPTEGWEYSYEAYQISVLQSFHILKMTLYDKNKDEVEQKSIRTLADVVFFDKTLDGDDTIEIVVPMNEYYDLKKGEYTFSFEYRGDTIIAADSIVFNVK